MLLDSMQRFRDLDRRRERYTSPLCNGENFTRRDASNSDMKLYMIVISLSLQICVLPSKRLHTNVQTARRMFLSEVPRRGYH